MTITTVVEAMKVDQPLPTGVFTFVPPAAAKLVGSFEYPGVPKKPDFAGKSATNFTLRDLQNKDVQLSDLRGKTVLLDFWATWCGPCREEIPALQKLQKYNKELTVLGIDVGEDSEVVRKFVNEKDISYPILLAGNNRMLADYSVTSYPTVVIIDKDGIIRDYIIGYGPGSAQNLSAGLTAAAKPLAEATTTSATARAAPESEILTAEGAYRRGTSLIRAHKSAEGIAMLSKALAMKPDWAQAYMARGKAQYQEKRYVEALRDFDEAIRLDPNNPLWYTSRGLAYSYSGQHERALEDYTRQIEMAPRVAPNAYNDRGWAYVELNQPEKALADLAIAIRMSPDYQRAYQNRARAYIALKDWSSAIADLTAALQISPTSWAYERRAEAKRAMHDEAGAAEDSKKAAELRDAPPQVMPEQ